MREQNFELMLLAPEHEQTGADAASFSVSVVRHRLTLRGNFVSA
jgi:hypothetical protein